MIQAQDVFPTLIVFLVGCGLLSLIERMFSDGERLVLRIGFAVHVVCALMMVWVTLEILGGGDMMGYHALGVRLAAAIRNDFFNVFPDVVRVVFHVSTPLPIPIHGEGSPSGSMYSLSSIVLLVIGDSIYASCMTMSFACYFCRIAIYRVMRQNVDVRDWPAMAIGCLLVPSVSFWCSGLIKEAFAFCGLTGMFWGLNGLIRRQGVIFPALAIAAGAALVGVVKPYILMPTGAGLAGWLYFVLLSPEKGSMRSLWAFPVGSALGLIVVLGVGEIFPSYSFATLAEETLNFQEIYHERSTGDSTIMLFDPTAVAAQERGFVTQIIYAPLAILTALFRPAIFDAKNIQMLVNAIEVTAFTVVFVMVLSRNGIKGFFRTLVERPILAFCVLFVLAMSLGVGLAIGSLGSISRYRTPMMPFFAAALALGWRRRSEATEPTPALVEPPRTSILRVRRDVA